MASASRIQDNLQRFIRREMEIVPFVRSFKLVLIDVNDMAQTINRFSVSYEKKIDEEAMRLMMEMFTEADSVMESFDSTCRFEVLAYAKPGDENEGSSRVERKLPVRARFPFRMAAKTQIGGRALGETEPPTEKGLIGQTMRHAEVIMRLHTEGEQASRGALISENLRLQARVEALELERERYLKLKEEMLTVASVRGIQEAEANAKIERNRMLTARLMNDFMPLLKNAAPEMLKRLGLEIPTDPKALPQAKPLTPSVTEQVETHVEGPSTNDYRLAIMELVAVNDPEEVAKMIGNLPEDRKEHFQRLMGF